jgi:hypothetical protein
MKKIRIPDRKSGAERFEAVRRAVDERYDVQNSTLVTLVMAALDNGGTIPDRMLEKYAGQARPEALAYLEAMARLALQHDDHHFGVPIDQAIGCHIPSRLQVATMPARRLRPILDRWLWDTVNPMPSTDQVLEVEEILLARPDAEDFSVLISECRQATALR